MELKINEVQLPAPITFNYEELKQDLLAKAETYASIVYTEDQIKSAKADRANLNRLKKALNDERLKREKEYMVPFNDFKEKVNEIISIIDKPCAVIDKQVKKFEDKQKAEKEALIWEYWKSKDVPDWMQTINTKWLNASVTMKSIQDEIDADIEQKQKELAVIRSLAAYAFEAEEMYKHTASLSDAVSEAHRLQEQAEKRAAWEAEQAKRKAEAEAASIRPAVTPEEVAADFIDSAEKVEVQRKWIGFQALLSVDEAKALGAWLNANGIKYKAI